MGTSNSFAGIIQEGGQGGKTYQNEIPNSVPQKGKIIHPHPTKKYFKNLVTRYLKNELYKHGTEKFQSMYEKPLTHIFIANNAVQIVWDFLPP